MKQYIWNRLASGLLVLVGLSVFTFGLIQMIPGDPVRMMLGEKATKEQVEQLRESLGLNKPLVEQYAIQTRIGKRAKLFWHLDI